MEPTNRNYRHREGKRPVTFFISIDLYNLYAKACIDADITMTTGFVRYLEYLKGEKSERRGKKLLYEGKESSFRLEE